MTLGFSVNITAKHGALDRSVIGKIEAILQEQEIAADALHKRAIPRTATDLEPPAKFQLVWIILDDEKAAHALASEITEQTGNSCTVRETSGAN